MNTWSFCGALAVLALVAAAPRADSRRAPLPPAYVEECGACHVAYPARLLDAASWNTVLDGLDRHFGVDASLEPQVLETLRAHLQGGARRKPTASDGKPQLRITETRWFRHEHDEVPARLWREPDAVKAADCAACHRDAATGSYSERSLRLPAKEKTK